MTDSNNSKKRSGIPLAWAPRQEFNAMATKSARRASVTDAGPCKITRFEQTSHGEAAYSGMAIIRDINYLFFADRRGHSAVFKEEGPGFSQIAPNTPRSLSRAVRAEILKAVQS